MLDVNEEQHNKKQNVQEIIVRIHHEKSNRSYCLNKENCIYIKKSKNTKNLTNKFGFYENFCYFKNNFLHIFFTEIPLFTC